MKSNSTRRDFVLRGGAVLGAGVATTAAAAALRRNVDVPAEKEAIRQLYLQVLAGAERREPQALELMHTAYRQDSRQQMDAIVISEDGANATARFHVEAEVCTPIQGDCTAAQMARLQGNVASRHWESGRFDVKLAKTHGNWRIVSLTYGRAPETEP